jgi:hypothetical protein
LKETTITSDQKSKLKRAFCRLLTDRKGTAEIVGGVFLVLILVFFFTNVYLWNDRASSQMNTLNSQKMNSQVSIASTYEGLVVTNNGDIDVCLSRLWVSDSYGHLYAELQNIPGNPNGIWIPPGNSVTLYLSTTITQRPDNSPMIPTWNGNHATIPYPASDAATFKILTTLGNGASCAYSP